MSGLRITSLQSLNSAALNKNGNESFLTSDFIKASAVQPKKNKLDIKTNNIFFILPNTKILDEIKKKCYKFHLSKLLGKGGKTINCELSAV